MRFGADIWVLYPKLGLEDTLRVMEDLELRYIEYPYELFKSSRPEDVEARVAEVAGVAESYSLIPYQLHAEYGDICFELSSPDEGVRGSAFRRLCRWIEYASKLGVRVLVVHAAFPRPSLDMRYDEVVKRIIELNVSYVRELAKLAEDHGVIVAVENCMEPWFCSSPQDLLLLMEAAASEHVGVCVDTGHFNVNSINPADAIRRLSGYIVATHLHDNDGRHDQHLPPLSGNIDWRGVMGAFREAGYEGPLIYEFGSFGGQSPRNVVETLKLVTEYLKALA